ncbi:ComEA family DNA-binding protein [Stutzerimonas balearica]|uniref:ComEA family DNA-binding protein n=1 Tax=Stutzerimonas balearica TaxID=74829 RepID=UPI0020166729|nr:helix-hairpin-helix domain-containing protein [Stutzerimonas balearica]
MDNSILSESNKELAKAHIDFLGSWLEKVNKLTNKGVHAELEQLEAVKSVFHTYLVVADILNYLKITSKKSSKLHIESASLDELEALLSINRSVAKEIVKVRATEGGLDIDSLSRVKGIGPKTIEKAKEVFELE